MAKVIVGIAALTLVLIGVSTVFVWQGFQTEAAITESWKQREYAHRLAGELRHSSDDLTRMARTYAATGDERYRRYFEEILAIRNGEAPRPRDYHLVYWDLVVADDTRPRPNEEKVALRTLLEGAGFQEDELLLLEESEDESNALTVLENEAFAAVRRGDLQAAQELLHSEAYHQAKAQIMLPIHNFVQAMEKRTGEDVAVLVQRQEQLNRYFLTTTALLLALVAVALVMARVAVKHNGSSPSS